MFLSALRFGSGGRAEIDAAETGPAQEQKIELMPTKRRSASRSFGATPLTSEEFASLKEVAMQRTIPDEHRDRLIEAGYIRELVRPSTSLALTGRGLRRLALGK